MKNLDRARKEEVKKKILSLHSGSPKKYRVKYYKKICRLINTFAKYCNTDKKEMEKFVLKALGEKCCYCGDIIDAKNISGDHIIPLTRGGVSYLSNFNIVCLSCNQRKGDLLDLEYKELLSMIDKWSEDAKRYVLTQLRKSDYYGS